MVSTIISTVVMLGVLGAFLAIVLYFIAQKFKVYEDPRIDQVAEVLPGANCGGCGFAGCRALAEAFVAAEDISTLYCPVGGSATATSVAKVLGKEAQAKDPMVAVVRCSGSCANRPRTSEYDGATSCAVVAQLYGGETACTYGCLGKGDCEVSCSFDALHMNPETGLPEIDEEKCTACGACVKACPKIIIEMRKKGPKGKRIYVSCINKDKGAVAKKACNVACIGCSKCFKVCPFEAITMVNNLSYIDFAKCKLCRKCVEVCPTNSILEINFAPRVKKEETAAETTNSDNTI